jgi:type IV pilus assembly protein PilC
MILNAGIVAKNGILMMQDDENDKDGKTVLDAVLKGLDNNLTLSESLEESKYFPQYMTKMIAIGEKTGRVCETLKSLSEHYERREKLALSIKRATIYPAVMLAMMIAVIIILVVRVLPIFNDVFERIGTRMSPFATRLMEFGIWFRGASVTIAVILFILFALALLIYAVPAFKKSAIAFVKNNFGDSRIFGKIASFQFISSMSIAISSGLNTEEAFDMAASLNSDSKALAEKYAACKSALDSGKKLSDALKESAILSARDCRMISLGEQSGTVDSAMAEIARRNDAKIQDELTALVGRIEPNLVIVTSVIIGVILLSVMLPLMGIMTSIG